jgi:hypothetical protein
MKAIIKVLTFVIVGFLIAIFLFIVTIHYFRESSQIEITRIVSEIPPRTLLSSAIAKLGKPNQVYEDEPSIKHYSFGKNTEFYSDCNLYMFVHDAVPYRWILIYTDKDSIRVKRSDWVDM